MSQWKHISTYKNKIHNHSQLAFFGPFLVSRLPLHPGHCPSLGPLGRHRMALTGKCNNLSVGHLTGRSSPCTHKRHRHSLLLRIRSSASLRTDPNCRGATAIQDGSQLKPTLCKAEKNLRECGPGRGLTESLAGVEHWLPPGPGNRAQEHCQRTTKLGGLISNSHWIIKWLPCLQTYNLEKEMEQYAFSQGSGCCWQMGLWSVHVEAKPRAGHGRSKHSSRPAPGKGTRHSTAPMCKLMSEETSSFSFFLTSPNICIFKETIKNSQIYVGRSNMTKAPL